MRRNIFIAFSDDIGLDYFRRYGRRRFSYLEKENFIEYYKMGKEDIQDLAKNIDNPKRFFFSTKFLPVEPQLLDLKTRRL